MFFLIMKNSIPFQCRLTLTPVGAGVVSASVDFSYPLTPVDREFLSVLVVDHFVSESCRAYLLDSGAFVLVKASSDSFLSPRDCVPSRSDFSYDLKCCIELADGKVHDVVVSLVQSDDGHSDFHAGRSLGVVLRGSLMLDCDETQVED